MIQRDLFGDQTQIECEKQEIEEIQNRLDLAAEYLVAFDLTLNNCFCSMAAPGLRYDIISDNGHLLRIQCKGTARPRSISYNSNKYRVLKYKWELKQNYSETADIFAFVAMDTKRILYADVDERRSFELDPSKMTEDFCNLSRYAIFGK